MSPAVRRFTRAELLQHHGATVDDFVGPDVRLLFVGINPGLWTAAVNAHFARPGNRFWPALHRAGITPWQVDASGGMRPADIEMLHARGIGISNIAPNASARADELTADDLLHGAARLEATVARLRPRVVAVLGLTAYRQAFHRPKATAGRQDEMLGDAALWVLPNPSGLNAHETVDSLAVAYAAAARAAGLDLP
ncbi:MAG: mismatch-specific DNA-glycosylase [Actinobacteria bacterium]|nr:mismatch-specific DNA-glycosylase [Actinomycetota bacterium]